MKKIKFIITFLVAFFISSTLVYAAPSANLTVNRTTIENGQNVTATVTISNAASWNITVSSSGSTAGCTRQEVGDTGTGRNGSRTFTFTCRATSTGTINFTLSGTVDDQNLVTRSVSGSRNVTVTAVTPRSTNNNLTALAVEGFDLSPTFASNVLEYNVEVAPGATSVTINATVADRTARVSGTGERSVEEGDNRLEVTVTAENGSTRTFVINVFVPERAPIEVTVDGEHLNVLRRLPEDIPPHFERVTLTIDNEEIEGLYNEFLGINLVYIRDEGGNFTFHRFEDGVVKGPFITILSDTSFIILENIEEALSRMILVDLDINGQNIRAMQTRENNQFFIVKGTNILTGETNLYHYDHINSTLSLFDEAAHEEMADNQSMDNIQLIIFSLGIALIVVQLLIICLLASDKSKLKKALETKTAPKVEEEHQVIEPEVEEQPKKKKGASKTKTK